MMYPIPIVSRKQVSKARMGVVRVRNVLLLMDSANLFHNAVPLQSVSDGSSETRRPRAAYLD